MTLIDRVDRHVARPREVERASSVTMEEFAEMLGVGAGAGKSKAGVSVTADRAMGNTAWNRGVTYLTEQVSGLPWHLYRRLPGGGRERQAKPPWLAAPDAEQTWLGFIEYVMVALLHRGNSFAFKLRNSADQVVGLREIHPDRVTTGIAPDGTKRFLVDRNPRPWTTREVLHIAGLVLDAGRFGYNPIRIQADSLGIVIAADEYAGRFYANSTHMSGYISVPEKMTREAALRMKAEWDEFHQGLLKAHQTGVLSAGQKYERIALNAAEAQLLESRQFGVTDIARALGVAPHKLYDLSRATFSNIEHQSIESVTDSIRPKTQRIETAINADRDLVPPGYYVEAELDGLMRGDSITEAQSMQAAINGGWMTPATAARLKNLPSPEELDYYLRPLNMAKIRVGEPEVITEEAAA